MSTILLKRGTSTKINSYTLTEGELLYDTTTKQLVMGIGTTRLKTSLKTHNHNGIYEPDRNFQTHITNPAGHATTLTSVGIPNFIDGPLLVGSNKLSELSGSK